MAQHYKVKEEIVCKIKTVCKMIVCKVIVCKIQYNLQGDSLQNRWYHSLQEHGMQFVTLYDMRIDTICKNRKCIRKERRSNFKKLLKPHQLVQSPSVECIQGWVQVGKTSLALVHLSILLELTKKGQPSQGHCFPSIAKEIHPQQI